MYLTTIPTDAPIVERPNEVRPDFDPALGIELIGLKVRRKDEYKSRWRMSDDWRKSHG